MKSYIMIKGLMYLRISGNFTRILQTLIILFFSSLTFAQTDTIHLLQHPTKDTSISQIEVINKSFDRFVAQWTEKDKNDSSIWDTLIPLLIGSALTLLTQFAIEYWKTQKKIGEKKREIISKGRAKTYLIVQILKDLAMYKVHKQYYLRAFELNASEDSFKKHYEKGQQQRETEIRLDDNIAEYFQMVTEYSIVTKNSNHFQQHFQAIFQYNHPKSYKFSDCFTSEELVAGLEKEEARLNIEYKNLTDILETIQTEMR